MGPLKIVHGHLSWSRADGNSMNCCPTILNCKDQMCNTKFTNTLPLAVLPHHNYSTKRKPTENGGKYQTNCLLGSFGNLKEKSTSLGVPSIWLQINPINKTAKKKRDTRRKNSKVIYLETFCGLLEPEGRVSTEPGLPSQVLGTAFCILGLPYTMTRKSCWVSSLINKDSINDFYLWEWWHVSWAEFSISEGCT